AFLDDSSYSASCALKVFSTREDAYTEWDMLVAHEDDLTVPSPYAVGLVEHEGVQRWAMLMEFVEGTSLSELMEDTRRRTGRGMFLEDALRIMAPIVRFAANCCHSRRVDVHRDIKPSNIVIDVSQTTRLLDFGIASNARGGRRARGTEFFAAPEIRFPERSQGDPDDARVDSYGIAATLYALTLGEGEPPSYAANSRALGRPFLHDDAMRAAVAKKAARMAEERFSVEMAPDSIERACNAAFSHMDERVRDALTRGLALHQADRPDSAKLERLLPLDRDEYEYRLVSEAVQECLRLACECGAFADHVMVDESGRDFIDALDAFNAGRYGEAVPILRAQAAKGNAAATYYLGVCVRDGLGIDGCDLQQAAWLFSEAAEAGNMLAQNALGRMLYEGRGVPKNERLGEQWIRAAARDDAASGRCGFAPAKEWLASRSISSQA
ncbi:Sel1-like repeat-containing protein kinase family protein, partial [Slackia piriformis]